MDPIVILFYLHNCHLLQPNKHVSDFLVNCNLRDFRKGIHIIVSDISDYGEGNTHNLVGISDNGTERVKKKLFDKLSFI